MARLGNSLLALTVIAAGVIAVNRFVGFDDAQASVAGQKVKGVADYDAAAAGATISATAKGTAWVVAGAAVDVGDGVVSDAQGRAVSAAALALAAGAVAVTSSAANGAVLTGGEAPQYVAGEALTAASAAGDLIEILLR